ncbi:MAG: GuaB3 family IMP dehydrogenase-related protein [Actinobacteria bacterium]|nr:GuaB3 family IMP dehydrogenase-related protein [Actinomycetota bacterium]
MSDVTIGLGRTARSAWSLDDLSIVPTRRTRDAELVDISWEVEAFRLELPFLAGPLDAVVSPESAAEIDRLGGVAVLDLEGLWARHEDPRPIIDRVAGSDDATALEVLRKAMEAPIDPDLVGQRIKELRAAGIVSAGAVTPQRTIDLAEVIVAAELDLLLLAGTVVSAEHVTDDEREPLDLKTFVRRFDVPVIVGGCTSHRSALHLMRTGAAGVLVGGAATSDAVNARVLGIGLPQATAIADVRAARRRHLEETGVYVQIIASGPLHTGGDIAKAIACGADAVLLGPPLAAASDSAARGALWGQGAVHQRLGRGGVEHLDPVGTLEEILIGPARDQDGVTNLFGALRATMAMCGLRSLAELRKADLVVNAGRTVGGPTR